MSTPPPTPGLGRLIQFQPLRGTQADLQLALPLAFGELYFAVDTGNLFMGTPGFGLGYVQIGDMSVMNQTLLVLLGEMRAARKALAFLAAETGRAQKEEFDPEPVDPNHPESE